MSTENNFHVGKKMEELLDANGNYTRGEIAELMDISRPTWNLLRKEERPKLEYVKRFCKILKIDFEKEFAQYYADELEKITQVAEARAPYISKGYLDLQEELVEAQREIIEYQKREIMYLKLLASNGIKIPD